MMTRPVLCGGNEGGACTKSAKTCANVGAVRWWKWLLTSSRSASGPGEEGALEAPLPGRGRDRGDSWGADRTSRRRCGGRGAQAASAGKQLASPHVAHMYSNIRARCSVWTTTHQPIRRAGPYAVHWLPPEPFTHSVSGSVCVECGRRDAVLNGWCVLMDGAGWC